MSSKPGREKHIYQEASRGFRVQIKENGKAKHIGWYATQKQAVKARDAWLKDNPEVRSNANMDVKAIKSDRVRRVLWKILPYQTI